MSDSSVMTEISDIGDKLRPAAHRFVLQWGEMGGKWGVNRSVAQIHALLYLANRPLTAEDISEALAMARSNVSNSIRELQSWGLIRSVPLIGDRREYFEADTDIWSIAAKIVAGRKQREIDPAIAALNACVAEAKNDAGLDAGARQRLTEMLEFTETVSRWYEQMSAVPRPKMMVLIKLGSKIINLLPKRKVK